MRNIEHIIIHCSATYEGDFITVEDITEMHKKRGFRTIGYHYVVYIDGSTAIGRPIDQQGAHCKGHNHNSIGICYVGGLDENGKAKDTRTTTQKDSLVKLIKKLIEVYPIKSIKGHRDYSKDLNGDGVISSNEWMKQCPCFDAQKEYKI